MENNTQVIDLNYIQNKLSKVRKSCVTPEQKATYSRYAQLYRDWLARYNNDFGYQVRVDFKLLIITSFIIAMGAVTLSLYVTYLIFSKP